MALSPPHPSTNAIPSTSDSIRRFNLAGQHTTKVLLAPFGFLALHTSSLAYFNPELPPSLVRYGMQNGINTSLITWSKATCIPLALILGAGVPLRLVSYASLGKNFTFILVQPSCLTTTGIYHYIQHPSYTGLVVLVLSNVALLGRIDGALSCWIPPSWYLCLKYLWWISAPIGVAVFLFGVRTRVKEEEQMLKADFGDEWEAWNTATSRFVPCMF